MRSPLLPLLTGTLALALAGCESDCLGDACPGVPDEPWDPDEGVSEDEGYGYGYGDDGGGSDGGGTGDEEEEEEREILTVRDCAVELRWIPPGSPSTVEVAGEFNDWTPAALSPAGDGVWSAELGELAPGVYGHKFIVDGSWEGAPPVNVYTKWSDGTENRALRVGDCTKPLLQTVSASASSGGTLEAVVQFASAADGTPIDPAATTVTVAESAVTPDIDVEAGTITVSLSGLAPGKHSLRVTAADTAGTVAENELFVPLWVEDEAFEWEDSLLYFVFTDRFRNGDYGSEPFSPVADVATTANYQGGDFQGVIDALEEGYFDELGVNTLWLSPVYENPEGRYLGTDGTHWYTGYHGYWPTEALGIEQRWGTAAGSGEEKLAELIEKAHERGIRVLFDLVLNHVHEDHHYLGEHPEWFGDGCVCGAPGCGWEEKPVECWFTDYLPDLNYKQHDLTERVLADTMTLVRDYDVDAVRIDAAKHMDHVIMRSLRKRLEEEFQAGGGAEFYLVGETFTSDRGLIMDYVGDHELTGQFDFPLYYAIRSTFTGGGGSFRDLENAVVASADAYGDGLMSPFLGNHDIERFATAVTGRSGDPWAGWLDDPMAEGGSTVTEWDVINKASMAFVFTLTQPGVPLIYYGDEIGLHGGGDPDNRRFMSFAPYLSANQETLLERVRATGQAVKASTAIRRGQRRQLWVDDDFYVYAMDNGAGDVAVIAMNKGSSRTESIDLSSLGVDGATFTDALGSSVGGTVSGGRLSISLDSWQSAILVRP